MFLNFDKEERGSDRLFLTFSSVLTFRHRLKDYSKLSWLTWILVTTNVKPDRRSITPMFCAYHIEPIPKVTSHSWEYDMRLLRQPISQQEWIYFSTNHKAFWMLTTENIRKGRSQSPRFSVPTLLGKMLRLRNSCLWICSVTNKQTWGTPDSDYISNSQEKKSHTENNRIFFFFSVVFCPPPPPRWAF